MNDGDGAVTMVPGVAMTVGMRNSVHSTLGTKVESCIDGMNDLANKLS